MRGGVARIRAGVQPGRQPPAAGPADPAVVLASLPDPVIVIGGDGHIRGVNPAAEQFLGSSAAALHDMPLAALVARGSPLLALVDTVRRDGRTISEYNMVLEGPRFGRRAVTMQAAPAGEGSDMLVLALHERSILDKMDRQLTHRDAARSLAAMAAMLAHEIKNPLSGIRGAAQLLEQDADAAGRELTRLICDETDRIVALVDRMGGFCDFGPIAREAVNIHQVLERVRRIAQSGFARHVRLIEQYDPSLPPVYGNGDLLVQAFLNIVKNAAEAAPESGGEIVLTTAYRHGLRLAGPEGEGRRHLPLMVSVADNGAGIPEDLRACLFDPFVTGKRQGGGLGLAVVARVVHDHGGGIEFDSEPGRTVFRVFLPAFAESAGGQ